MNMKVSEIYELGKGGGSKVNALHMWFFLSCLIWSWSSHFGSYFGTFFIGWKRSCVHSCWFTERL